MNLLKFNIQYVVNSTFMHTNKIVIFFALNNYVLFLHKTLMVPFQCIVYVIVTHVTDTHQCVMYNML